jgi:hypothetical protein
MHLAQSGSKFRALNDTGVFLDSVKCVEFLE